jgi:pimeloyl-ACP methyl ester carboxylesterase
MLLFLAGLFLCLAALAASLLVWSPGKLKPFLDDRGQPLANSVSEKIFMKIGGVRQGMFIRGQDVKNPVLLFVHGGPCFPTYFMVDKYPSRLEDHFTVCYWEERGGGLSYSRDVTPESMTFEQLTSDAIEVANYLRERFGQEKIFLMAHSGGTPLAILAAAKAPQLFRAYVGMAQITRQGESEKRAYRYILEQYTASGNARMVSKLKEYPILESDSYLIPFYHSLVRDKTMHALGVGTMRTMRSVFNDVVMPVMKCRAYTLREKINIWVSKFSFLKKTGLIQQVFAFDAFTQLPKLEIPIYFFSGRYDLTVNHDLAAEYLRQLQAPAKGFYIFDESAHSPLFEEPQKVKDIMIRDVLTGSTALADKR